MGNFSIPIALACQRKRMVSINATVGKGIGPKRSISRFWNSSKPASEFISLSPERHKGMLLLSGHWKESA